MDIEPKLRVDALTRRLPHFALSAILPGVIEAVVFDWGGTLTRYVHVDPLTMWVTAARGLANERNDVLCDALTRAEDSFWLGVQGEARSGTLATLMESVFAELGVTVPQSRLDEVHERYLRAWTHHVEHRTDAAHVLGTLRDRGVKVGLLSNTLWPASFHDELLARDGLLELIAVRHYTSDRTWMKPHPEVFTGVLDEIGVANPRSAVFVGDRAFDDVFGARRAGMRTVLVANDAVPAFDIEPDARIVSLTELLDLVADWSA